MHRSLRDRSAHGWQRPLAMGRLGGAASPGSSGTPSRCSPARGALHAGLAVLAGGYVGVDVFFVISGFLITRLLLGELDATGRISLRRFYARRARRMLPGRRAARSSSPRRRAAAVNSSARANVGDIVWAALYTANWHFAAPGGRLLRQGQPTVAGAALLVAGGRGAVLPRLAGAAARRRPRRRGAAPAAGSDRRGRRGPGVASLACSIHSHRAPARRRLLLDLHARLGARARRGPGDRRAHRRASRRRWLGLAAICTRRGRFSNSTPFPGYAALLPMLGAALVIAAAPGSGPPGCSRSRRSATSATLLLLLPLALARALFVAEYVGHDLSTAVRLGLLAGAFGLSILSYGLYENPIRKMSWRPQTGALLWPASAAVILAVAVPILIVLNARATRISKRRPRSARPRWSARRPPRATPGSRCRRLSRRSMRPSGTLACRGR